MTKLPFLLLIMLFTTILPVAADGEGVYRTTFTTTDHTLTVEILDDDLAHFELKTGEASDSAIWTTPMVAKTDYTGPSQLNQPAPNIIETPDLRVNVDEATLCVTITDLTRDPELILTTLCPLGEAKNGLAFTQEGTTDLYGLGEQFQRRGGTEGNWMGLRRRVLNLYGNELASFNGGNVGNAQFPILYALGPNTENYALFLDDFYQQYWDFSGNPFTVTSTAATTRWYIMTGEDLPDLRRDYMELTGRPPVPPRQMFGLWVSEYGYESWEELTTVLNSMQEAKFPLDGMVLDLQWFSGIIGDSQMGSLAWDETNFPDPAGFIAGLREQYGLGIMTIEEPYVADTVPDYADPAVQAVLVRECGDPHCEPVSFNEWWGDGSMVDWTNPEAAAWWHDNRRQHLIEEGVIGHWTDLGEPEIFDEAGWYYGFPYFNLHDQASVHNLYNFLWSKSVWEGYQRNDVERRPFIMSRSGTSGSQRYGVSMWSGDIAANMPSLAAHLNVQMHMSMSGMDYFGSDIGGFYRQAFDPVLGMEGMYTLWLANSALLDIPLRAHAANLQNLYATAPSLIGDVPSNLANVQLRYALAPYLYSLAHQAYRNGDTIFAPMVYYFQNDPVVRTMGSQKMIGANLMMTTLTGYGETVPVYLPAGGWFNYYTSEYIVSAGEWIEVPAKVAGLVRVPLFVRDGAIIPQMHVDDQTLNMLGQRRDGSSANQLMVNIYQGEVTQGDFLLTEDDGETMAYQTGEVRDTLLTYEVKDDGLAVNLNAEGNYNGAPDERAVKIQLITPAGIVDQSGSLQVGTPLVFEFAPEVTP